MFYPHIGVQIPIETNGTFTIVFTIVHQFNLNFRSRILITYYKIKIVLW